MKLFILQFKNSIIQQAIQFRGFVKWQVYKESTYYKWLDRNENANEQLNKALIPLIKDAYQDRWAMSKVLKTSSLLFERPSTKATMLLSARSNIALKCAFCSRPYFISVTSVSHFSPKRVAVNSLFKMFFSSDFRGGLNILLSFSAAYGPKL